MIAQIAPARGRKGLPSASMPATFPTPTGRTDLALEAARYALLRRLAFPIRHDMAGHLQPVNMVGEVLVRRLRADSPDPAKLEEGVTRLLGLTRTAMTACLDVVTWLAPEAKRQVTVREAVDETVSLLRGSLAFRGFALRDETGEAPWPVQRNGIRLVLPACLLLLSDEAGPPAEITISADEASGAVRLVLALEPGDGPDATLAEPPYRTLTAAEVDMIARAEGMTLVRGGDRLELSVPLAQVG
jgi:hypothetical protein